MSSKDLILGASALGAAALVMRAVQSSKGSYANYETVLISQV
jgi:hypothetical protein